MAFRRTDRRRFSRAVMQIAWARCKDAAGIPRCQGCTACLAPGKYVYDHVDPWELSHDSSLDNCQLLCAACDDVKTPLDLSDIARSNRVRDRHSGARARARHPMPCGRASRHKKPIGGYGIVPRVSQLQKHARYIAGRAIAPAPEASP